MKELLSDCRLLALDYPGFGMSKAPSHYGFTPQEQADAVVDFIGRLNLKQVVLVVQDWGGPIGFHYAVRHRENLRGIVVMNTWAWPATVLPMKLFSLAMGGWPLGYWLLMNKPRFLERNLVTYCHTLSVMRRNSMKTILWATLTANGYYAQSSAELELSGL